MRGPPSPSVFERFKECIATPDLPGLGPKPRAGRFPVTRLNAEVERFIAAAKVPAPICPLVRSAALLWHDHLDDSHAISQDIHTADGSFLHGIMHRREPDYGNAKYWFNRVGRHNCFNGVAARATDLLSAHREIALARQLAPGGGWDPMAFVNACEVAAAKPPTDSRVRLLQKIQEIEFDCLMEYCLR